MLMKTLHTLIGDQIIKDKRKIGEKNNSAIYLSKTNNIAYVQRLKLTNYLKMSSITFVFLKK